MFFIIALVIVTAIVLSAVVGTVATTARDGYRQVPTRDAQMQIR